MSDAIDRYIAQLIAEAQERVSPRQREIIKSLTDAKKAPRKKS